jgi:hypothetical protein
LFKKKSHSREVFFNSSLGHKQLSERMFGKGFVLAKRFIFLLASVLFGFAVFRVWRNSEKSDPKAHRGDSTARISQLQSPPVEGQKSSLVVVPRSHLQVPDEGLLRGRVGSLFQNTKRGQKCWLGRMRIEMIKEREVLFRSRHSKLNSLLSLWSSSRSEEIYWDFRPSTFDSLRPEPFVPTCSKWVFQASQQDSIEINAQGRQVFLKSTEFAEVRPLKRASEIMKADPRRGGWTVSASAGQHRFVVRHAETLLYHHLTIHFPVRKNPHTGFRQKKMSRRDRFREFAIPGWD